MPEAIMKTVECPICHKIAKIDVSGFVPDSGDETGDVMYWECPGCDEEWNWILNDAGEVVLYCEDDQDDDEEDEDEEDSGQEAIIDDDDED